MKSSNKLYNYYDKFDFIITAAIVILFSLFMFLFFRTVNKITGVYNKEHAAVIIFRKNKAQRQYSDSLKWERLLNESKVYNNDTIRTGNFSEASLNFDDGTKIDLADNTLIKLRTTLNQNLITFQGGSFSVNSDGKNSRDFSVSTEDGAVIKFTGSSSASIIENDGFIAIGVDSGNASFEKDGISHSIDRTQEIYFNSQSGVVDIVSRNIFPVNPSPDMKFIAVDSEQVNILFAADIESIDRSNKLFLELSDSPGFNNTELFAYGEIEGDSVSMESGVKPGIWYWRFVVKDSDGKFLLSSSVRRFAVYHDRRIGTVTPFSEEVFTYRNKMPKIQFTWTETEYADNYIIELSRDDKFAAVFSRVRTNTPSIVTDNLSDGKWFWRVSPVYSFLRGEQVFMSNTGSFTVVKKDEMDKPSTVIPADKFLFEIVRASDKGLGFSWKRHKDAERYQFGIAHDRSMSDMLITEITQLPYLRLQSDKLTSILKEGKWYWGVRAIDEEGNHSQWSDIKEINGVDAALSQRLIYPPDNYIISDSFITNTRFTWQSNIPAKKFFQVSSDINFSKIYYSREIEADTLIGRNWETGKWYWRIRTINADNSVFLDSEIRSFEIVPPFKEVVLKYPEPSSTLIVYDEKIKTISWEPAANADYYSITLTADGEGGPFMQIPLYDKTSLDLDVTKYNDMKIIVTIRAGADEKDNATRILGLIGRSEFMIKRLKPVNILTPLPSSSHDGLNVFRNGIKIQWNSEEKIVQSNMIISTDPYGKNTVFQKFNPSAEEIVKNLKEGVYYCNVTAVTEIGYEISVTEPVRFTILPIQPLPEAKLTAPSNNSVIDFNYLRANRSVIFTWEKVNYATEYILSLWDKDNKLIFEEKGLKNTNFTFNDLSKLSRGKFTWKLEARSFNNGVLEQRGRVAVSQFTVDIPEVTGSTERRNEGLYGR